MGRILAGAILLVALFPTACASVKLDGGTMNKGLVAEIPFQLHGSMIVMQLSVDDSTPLSFIFDTAAGGTIVSARTAARLDIVGDETVSREGATGMATTELSKKHVLGAGDLNFQNVTLGIADLDHIERRLGMMIDGVIGWELLSQYAVRVDYDAMRIEVYDTKRFDYDLGVTAYDVEVQGTVVFTDVTVVLESGDTFTGKVLVDTGSGGCISFNTPFAGENDLLAKMGDNYARETQSLSTASSRIYTAMLASLSFGDHEFAEVPANVATAEAGALSWSGIMGILGNGVLKRFNMFIDLQEQRMYLDPNGLYHDVFEVDCSGVELVMDDSFQKVIVDHVYAGSPAHEAGLKAGDEIAQIDAASASSLGMPQIRSVLSQNGRDVEIVVDRKGELHSFLFRLQALIE